MAGLFPTTRQSRQPQRLGCSSQSGQRGAAGIGLGSLTGQHATESLFDIAAEALRTECRIALVAKHYLMKVGVRLHVLEQIDQPSGR